MLVPILLLLAGCVAPAAPQNTLMSPLSHLQNPSGEVAVVGGGDALLGGNGRIARPVGDNMVMDLGVTGGYTFAGVDGGLWLRKKKRGWSVGTRLGGTAGVGTSMSSEVFHTGGATPLLQFDDKPFYFGPSIHWQVARKRPDKKGVLSVTYGSGVTITPIEVTESPFNFYIDLGLRIDRPSKLFYGAGFQLLPMSAGDDFPVPILPVVTLGQRF